MHVNPARGTPPDRRRLGALAAVALVSFAVARTPHAADRAAFEGVGERALETLFRPAHDAFAAAATALDEETHRLCPASRDADADPAVRLDVVRAAFADTVARFSVIEPLRVGPLLDDNRLNRLFYWPDTRQAGERQLRALLAEDAAAVDADSIPAQSVAVQGLPALERLLYGDASAALIAPDAAGGAHCAVTRAVAGNVAAVAHALEAAWREPDGIARELAAPRAEDELFRDPTEVVRSLLTQLDGGLDLLLERKIAPQLEPDPPVRRAAPFRRSALTYANLGGNVDALRALAIDSTLAARADLERELAFEFRVAKGHLERLRERVPAPPLPDALGEEEAGLLRALASTLSSIRSTLRERLAPALGVRTGFNAEDGD